MSQAAVEKASGKLITDEGFRRRFFKDPAGASFNAGLELPRAELEALSRLPQNVLTHFSARLDDRICRLPLETEGRRTSRGTPAVRRRRTATGAGPACDSAHETKEQQR